MLHIPVTPCCKRIISLTVVLLVICASALWGETTAATGGAAAHSSLTPPTIDELKNATYTGLATIPIKLNGGVYEGPPYVPGGVSRQRIELLNAEPVTGDLNGDGREESVVFLAEQSGGTMTVYHMVVMCRQGGEVVTIAAVRLGDRISVRVIRVDKGQITLDLLQHGAKDAACCPSDLATRVWTLERTGLVERAGQKWGGKLKLATLEGVEWTFRGFGKVGEGAGATLVFDRERISGVSGCNRYVGAAATRIPGELTLTASKATNRECSTTVMQQEDRYLAALRQTVRFGFFLGDLTLTVRKNDGTLEIMRFAPHRK